MIRKLFAALAGLAIATACLAVPPAISPAPFVSTVRPAPVAVCAGDSIMSVFCDLNTGSPIQESLRKYPRQFGDFINYAISGTYSGTTSGHTAVDTCTALKTSTCDLNTPTNIARIIAVKPDILFVETGGNDSSSNLTQTYANMKAFTQSIIAGLPNVKIVWMTSPPQSSRTGLYLIHMRSQLYGLQALYPSNIVVVPLELSGIDDQTTHGPVGGTGGSSTAVNDTTSGQHPGPVYARALEPVFTALMDQLGVPRMQPYATSAGDSYHATNCPGCNFIGALGSMSGGTSSAGLTNMQSGSLTAYDSSSGATWQLAAETEVIATSSVTSAGVTFQGNSFKSLHVVFGNSSAITADRYFKMSRGTTASFNTGLPMRASALCTLTSAVGVKELSLTLSGLVGGVNTFYTVGAPFTGYGSASYISNGTYALMLPMKMVFDSGNGLTIKINVTFRSGDTPAGSLDCAQINVFPQVAG